MRRAVVLLVVAGGLAALFATASRQPHTRRIVTERSYLIVTTDQSACSLPNREMLGAPISGPFTFHCHTHRQAERFQRRYPGAGAAVHGTQVVFNP
jgi:hypothetical protein